MAANTQSKTMPWIPESLLPAKTSTLNSWRHSHTVTTKISGANHQSSQVSNALSDQEETNTSKTLRELTRLQQHAGVLKPVVPNHYVRDGLIILNHSDQSVTQDKSIAASDAGKDNFEENPDQKLLLETLQFFESKRKKNAGTA